MESSCQRQGDEIQENSSEVTGSGQVGWSEGHPSRSGFLPGHSSESPANQVNLNIQEERDCATGVFTTSQAALVCKQNGTLLAKSSAQHQRHLGYVTHAES